MVSSALSSFCALAMAVLTLLFGSCSATQIPSTGTPEPDAAVHTRSISALSLYYNNSFGACGYSYEMEVGENGSAKLSYEADEHRDLGAMACELDASTVEAVEETCERYNVASWDGFSESIPYVTDGDGFYFALSYADGSTVSASGSNAFPKDYQAFSEELDAILAPYVDAMLAEKTKGAAGFSALIGSALKAWD